MISYDYGNFKVNSFIISRDMIF